jgi:MFS family permease
MGIAKYTTRPRTSVHSFILSAQALTSLDMIGRMNTLILSIGLCVVSCFALWMPAGESTAMIIVFAVIFGFVSGSNLSLSPVCVGMDPLWTAYLPSSAIFFEQTPLSRHI